MADPRRTAIMRQLQEALREAAAIFDAAKTPELAEFWSAHSEMLLTLAWKGDKLLAELTPEEAEDLFETLDRGCDLLTSLRKALEAERDGR